MTMNSRALAIGAFVLAVVVLALGLVLQNQADFSRNYVRAQLAERGISFTPVDALLPAQKKVQCLVANAGKPLTTGKQAECYAKYQIGIDLTLIDNGQTYFQSHYNGYLARVKAAAAVEANPNDPATLELVRQATDASRKADDLLAGEATRGLLLAGYGFSVIGDRLAQAALVCFVVAGLLLVAGVVMLVLANRKRPAAT
jgi:hypothetical protein